MDWKYSSHRSVIVVPLETGQIVRIPSDVYASLDYKKYKYEDGENYATIYLTVDDNQDKFVCPTEKVFEENYSLLARAIYNKTSEDE